MQIAQVAAQTIRWPIASHGAARGRTGRAAVLVEVRGDGAIGLGEAAPLDGLSRDAVEDAERVAAALAAQAPFELADRHAASVIAHAVAADAPAARFAIETALLDALARHRGVPLARLLADAELEGASPDRAPNGRSAGVRALFGRRAAPAPGRRARIPVAAVVDDPEAARAAVAAGIRCLKIKVGARDEARRVFAIAEAAPGTLLRIDANRSWARDEVVARCIALATLPIDYIEEPCVDAHLLTAERLPCRIALDESLAGIALDELRTALRGPRLAALVLKPTLLGGLSTVLALARLAREAGVAAIASHGLEGPIGTAACAELALALGGDQPVGLARHAALVGWRLDVPQLAADHVHPAAAPGLGFDGLDLAGAVSACSAASEP